MNISIAQTLDLVPGDCGWQTLLEQVAERWPLWAEGQAGLRHITSPADLPAELPLLPRDQQDEVLLALTTLGAHDGGDDMVAATAVVACLLPGADALARRLSRSFSTVPARDVVQMTAGHLWIAVREFHWRTAGKVCGSVLWATRNGVMREMGVGVGFEKSDKTWANTLTGPHPDGFGASGSASLYTPPVDSAADLEELLDEACDRQIISLEDRRLLVEIVAAAEVCPPTRGSDWLLTNAISELVAAQHGVCAKTIRRRARRSLDALMAAELVAA